MAERRMFSKLVVDADRFLDLPRGARLLYFELGMRCDDDGFCAAPGSILRMTGASREDFAALTAAGFVADLGPAALLLDWRVSNSLRSDRLRRLSFPELAEQVYLTPDGRYHLSAVEGSLSLAEYKRLYHLHRRDPFLLERKKCDSQEKRKEKKRTKLSSADAETRAGAQGAGPLDGADNGGEERSALEFPEDVPEEAADKEEEDGGEEESAVLETLGGTLGKGVVMISDRQISDLLRRMDIHEFDCYVSRLADYILEKNARVHSHYKTILRWWQEDRALCQEGGP